MSTKDRKIVSESMSKHAHMHGGQVSKGSTTSYVQGAVDSGKGAQQGLSAGMSNEGKQTGGKYSSSTSSTQSTVDKENQ